jgi:hypothetical protein
MKKTIIYFFSIVLTTLLCCGCEEEKIGAYPYSKIFFIEPAYVTINHSTLPIKEQKSWDSELYPMEFWVDETDMAMVDNQGYVTGLQLGTFTLHAKVMGKNGWVESSQLFTVGEEMSFLTPNQIDKLISLGVDKNNDGIITVSEMEQTEVLEGMIHSDFLLEIGKYFPNLKEVDVIADTSSRTLDLSMFKLRKLRIVDDCWWSKEDVNDYDRLKPFFLTELRLNNSLEHIIVNAMPGFPVMDLSEYTNLKTVSRDNYAAPQWANMTFILPPNIESINVSSASIVFNQVYNQLTTIKLAHCMPITIPKENVPNLKNIIYNRDGYYVDTDAYNRTLDISSYEASDLDTVEINWIKTVYVSQSIADNYLTKFHIVADNFIIQ